MNKLVTLANADDEPLKRDIFYVVGRADNEYVYAMESVSEDVFYLSGESGNDLFLLKLNVTKMKSGYPHYDWLCFWGGDDTEYFGDMIIDPSGNIYIAGSTDSYGAGHYDVYLLKFNEEGTLVWNITWGTSGDEMVFNLYRGGNCLVMDSMNNIYLAGSNGEDVFLIKFDNLGNEIWNRTWNILPAYPSDYFNDIKIDLNNNIYMAVVSEESYYGEVYSILKYNSDGDLQWNTTNPFYSGGLMNAKILVDSNAVYFGSSYSGLFLAKFDPNLGDLLWNNSFGVFYMNYGYNINYFIGMKFDTLGNIIFFAECLNFGWEDPDLILGKCNSGGVIQWNKTYYGNDFHIPNISPKDIHIYSENDIYVIASIDPVNDKKEEIFVLKYNILGELQYEYKWGSSEDDTPAKIFVDSSENIYVGGHTKGFGGPGDYNILFAVFSLKSPSKPAIPGYNIVLLLGALSIALIFISRKMKKN